MFFLWIIISLLAAYAVAVVLLAFLSGRRQADAIFAELSHAWLCGADLQRRVNNRLPWWQKLSPVAFYMAMSKLEGAGVVERQTARHLFFNTTVTMFRRKQVAAENAKVSTP